MRVLLIEDNEHHSLCVKDTLESTFKDTIVAVFKTESEVMESLEQIAREQPHIIILDIILPWCSPSPDMPDLPEDYDDGPYRAGIRCLKAFLKHDSLKDVPIIVHSVIGSEELSGLPKELPPTVLFLPKPLEPERMTETIESFLLYLHPNRKTTSTKDNVINASELKLGFKGFNLDLKKLLERKC